MANACTWLVDVTGTSQPVVAHCPVVALDIRVLPHSSVSRGDYQSMDFNILDSNYRGSPLGRYEVTGCGTLLTQPGRYLLLSVASLDMPFAD